MREAAAQMRAASRLAAAERKAQEQYLAQLEVEEYESRIEALTSLHRECTARLDWNLLAAHSPVVDRTESSRLQAELMSFRPTFIERIFGSKKRHAALVASFDEAVAREDGAWREAVEEAAEVRQTAVRVLAGDRVAYNSVIEATHCLDELREFGCDPRGDWIDARTAEVSIRVGSVDVVPSEAKALTGSGKLSTKKLPAARQMEIYQDFVCGAALRAARELTAVLPLRGALCHVRAPVLDTRTGHCPEVVVLSVFCPTDRLTDPRVNFARVDASDFVSTFLHKMRLTKGKGFQQVESLPPRGLEAHHE